MFELVDNQPQHAVIKVIGVGGGGGNDFLFAQAGDDVLIGGIPAKVLKELPTET